MALAIGSPEMEHMMRTGEYSDLRLFCRGVVFRVHKLVVCRQSAKIRDDVASDPQTNIVIMDNFRLTEVNRFVQFLYMGTYKEEPDADDLETQLQKASSDREGCTAEQTSCAPPPITSAKDPVSLTPVTGGAAFGLIFLTHIRMSVIGRSYGFQALTEHANGKLKKLLGEDSLDADKLSQLPNVIEHARQITNDTTIKDVLAETAALNIDRLKDMESFQKLSVLGPFALAILNNLASSGAKSLEAAKKEFDKEKKLLIQKLDGERASLRCTFDSEFARSQDKLEKQQAAHRVELNDLKLKHKSALEGAHSKYWPELVEARENLLNLEKANANYKLELERSKSAHRSELINARSAQSPELAAAKARIAAYERTVSLLEGANVCRSQSCYYDQFGCTVEVPNYWVSDHPFILRCNSCGCKNPE